MKINNFQVNSLTHGSRISAHVVWEDTSRAPITIYFDIPFKTDRCDPNAFLLSCYLPAFHTGERRIKLEGAASNLLIDGLQTVVAYFNSWRRYPAVAPIIEASHFRSNLSSRHTGSGALFLSGGVDSLFALTRNRALFDKTDPRHAKSALVIFGTSIREHRNPTQMRETFAKTIEGLQPIGMEYEFEIIPVSTNILELEPNVQFWMKEYHGSALAACAHASLLNTHTIFLGSTYDIANLAPWGSHPLIDSHYSSERIAVAHDGERFSRIEKLKYISDFLPSLQGLRVCNSGTGDRVNCGQCEKCIRTRLEFHALGVHAEELFADVELSAALIKSRVKINSAYTASCYRDTLKGLEANGRKDLLVAVQCELRRYSRRNNFEKFKNKVASIDRAYLNSSVRQIVNPLVGRNKY